MRRPFSAWVDWRRLALFATMACLQVVGGFRAAGAEIPPKPPTFVTDYANVTTPQFRSKLSAELEAFEGSDSTQILAVVFRSLPAGEDLESYTHRIAEGWGVGQKGKNNGAVLFLFVEDRRLRIEVGYGLEPRLTDALSGAIIQAMVPALRSGNYEGAVRTGVTSMMAAVRGEFKGAGRGNRLQPGWVSIVVFFIVVSIVARLAGRSRGYVYGRGARSNWGGGWVVGGGGFGGGGGFSGGGGAFGGGGASGSW